MKLLNSLVKRVTAIAALSLVLFVSAASAAAIQLNGEGCMAYAVWSRDIIWAREVGADKDKVRVSLIEMADTDESGVLRLVLREFENLWNTYAERGVVGNWVFRDCLARRGRYNEVQL